jgi:hypothetical protein
MYKYNNIMGGGLMSIASSGTNDLFLTGSPQITLFKIVYRRHTNFSKESVVVPINNMNFDNTVDILIPKNGDLVGEMYLQMQLPTTSFSREVASYAVPGTVIGDNTYNFNNIILPFMQLNMSAYRIAYADSQAINLYNQPLTMINDVLNVFNTYINSQTLILNYNTLLNNSFALSNQYFLDSNNSNIYSIITNIIANISQYPTCASIMVKIENALNISKQVQDFYFKLQLDEYNNYYDNINPNAKFAWVKKLGHVMIDYIDVSIGGEKIDRQYGDWLNVWHELAGHMNQEQIYDKMIGNVPSLYTYNRDIKPSYTLTIPLQFWFCRNSGLYIPLIALQYNDLIVSIKLKTIENCGYIEFGQNDELFSLSDMWADSGFVINSSLLVDYVYLDYLERKRFAQSQHEYLINRVQTLQYDDITDAKTMITLDFRSPCKEIIWMTQKEAYINNNLPYTRTLATNYSVSGRTGLGNTTLTAELLFNGYHRFKKNSGDYFNYVLPYCRHSNTPSDGINLYSFGLFPEEDQPSGSCNFTRIDAPNLILEFDPATFYYKLSDIDPSIEPDSITDLTEQTSIRLTIFAISYNILRIIGGMGALAYY